MDKVDIVELLCDAPKYVIIKIRGDFPDYHEGQDIDIIADDVHEMAEHLMRQGDYDWRLKMKDKEHYHLDIMLGDKIHLRFDLYGIFISTRFTRDALCYRFFHRGVHVVSDWRDAIIKCYEYKYNGKKKYHGFLFAEDNLNKYMDEQD